MDNTRYWRDLEYLSDLELVICTEIVGPEDSICTDTIDIGDTAYALSGLDGMFFDARGCECYTFGCRGSRRRSTTLS